MSKRSARLAAAAMVASLLLPGIGSAQQAAPAKSSATAKATSPAAVATSPEGAKRLVRGWLARIMPLGDDPKAVPADELGRFVATKDSYKLGDFARETTIRTGVDVGWKGEGFLDVTEVGRHTFTMNFTQKLPDNRWVSANHLCWGSITAEGRTVAQGQVALTVSSPSDSDIKSVVGGADLEPGRYRVEFWAVCGVSRNGMLVPAVDKDSLRTAFNIAFDVLVKRPGEALPIPASKALVLKVQSTPAKSP